MCCRKSCVALALNFIIIALLLGVTLPCVDAADSSQSAVWAPRKLHFVYMGFTTHYSCDGLLDNVRSALLQLGARASDLQAHEYGCTRGIGRPEPFPGVDATFSVLEPAGEKTSNAPVEARWQTVELKLGATSLEQAGQCELLEQIQQKILPLFTTRNLEFKEDCIPHQLTVSGATLRVQVLEPMQKPVQPPAN